MAKLIYFSNISLDNYVEDESGKIDWAEPDEEVHTFINNFIRSIGTFLFGRRMYEVMKIWESIQTTPDQPPWILDFANIWKNAYKIVYSKTMDSVSSTKTRIEREFVPDEIRQIKKNSSKTINIGGPTIAAQAIKAGLVDEYHLMIAPIFVGGGKSFFPRNIKLKLDLIEEQRFSNGTVYLHYNPRSE
jgi:dihydrofolate reductase